LIWDCQTPDPACVLFCPPLLGCNSTFILDGLHGRKAVCSLIMKNKRDSGSRQLEYSLVYSTSEGRICPDCSNPVDRCTCHRKTVSPKGDGIVRISRSIKGRKGKSVTIITGIPLVGDELKGLALKLKQRCGAGGTIKDGTIEIQGEHRDLLFSELTKLGYSVKRSGG